MIFKFILYPWFCLLAIFPSSLAAAVLPASIFEDGGYLVTRGGGIVAARNPERLLVPASTWKIATALLALERLGPDYRFATHFHLGMGDLYIRGFGDPLLVSEEVALIATRLTGLGVKEIGDIVLDDSFFQLERATPNGAGVSLRSYDAANGALVVNFNTINITVDLQGMVSSAEEQTPTLPVMKAKAGGLAPGTHRINLSQQRQHSLAYGGELFAEMLRRQGVKVNGTIRAGTVPAGGQPVYRHLSSRPLSEAVAAMLLYSNNFIANQLLLASGAATFGEPATWEKGRESLRLHLEEMGLKEGSFLVEEGSGLSRGNRITPSALLRLLELFRPYAQLLPADQGRLLKSGTLTGVYAYAGYFNNGGTLDPFVLILNQSANRRDRALELLEKHYRQAQTR
ncbi:D-alanyl-D-alanine carboxypeptidase/D-alanyl-D-alanine-endopeptidase [Desulfurivibrio sp. D14AmB]|uniref:D-alanyl-D-alanine carboxypeptidase/D-alanyl-D-alanine-endopeptidase n=1 Tax=Desulfurivibrio sp. D14AmB TaxID=3374370 RepID=UPI00376EEDAE